jgi:probable rRNA maturation factor
MDYFLLAPNIQEDINIPELETIVELILKDHSHNEADLTIYLTDDNYIKEINQQYRGMDASTDVLSFSNTYINPESGKQHLGDIVISVERAKEQAEQSNETFADEMKLLVIHGLLHLLGYDHENTRDKEIMWKKQEEFLSLTDR